MNSFLAALSAVIQPAIQYAEQKLASIGASFAAGLTVIALGFTTDQRSILTNVIAYWQAQYHAAVAAGKSGFGAIEAASLAALNEFASEEAAEGSKEVRAIITLLESSVTNSLKSPT